MNEPDQVLTDWPALFRVACSLIDQVNARGSVVEDWTLGGGTAMMLQIDHRESHDIDIFLPDPQYLAFLNPDTHDFDFELEPPEHTGDGGRFIRFAFAGKGQIDFIAAAALTENPTRPRRVEGVQVLLETVPEIIAKKVFHRGTGLKPRDVFDLAAANRSMRDDVVSALAVYREQVAAALTTVGNLEPKFVADAISSLMIKPGFEELRKSALDDAKGILASALGD